MRHSTCNFDNAVASCVQTNSFCHAERAIQICNEIQLYFMGQPYYVIRDEFEVMLQTLLTKAEYECLVFWTPEGEKFGNESKVHDRVRKTTWYKNKALLNDQLILVNEELHSYDFLRMLSDSFQFARSRVFRLVYNTNEIIFSVLYPDNQVKNAKVDKGFFDFEIRIPFPDKESPTIFLSNIDGERINTAIIKQYIDRWFNVCDRSSLMLALKARYKTELSRITHKEISSLEEEWDKCLRHFMFIALFSVVNGFSSCTYYLSPLDREHLKSSLVIYWSDREPERYFHYLIKMLLGLNAAPILYREERMKKIAEARKMALGHYGHTLKTRLDILNSFLDDQGPRSIKMHKDMLLDLTLILQLNTLDNREELLEHLKPKKQGRFLDIEGAKDVEKHIDIVKRLQCWSGLVGAHREFLIIDRKRGIHEKRYCDAELLIVSQLQSATIGLHMKAVTENGEKGARLKEAIYRELVLELLNNAIKYGKATQTRYVPGKPEGYLAACRT